MENIFAVYKPKGPTSFQMIAKLRKITGIKKIGHAGTLDPLASGVLVMGVGREATKKLGQYTKKDKEYIAYIKLGFSSTTDDEQGEKNSIDNRIPEKDEIKAIIKNYIGEILQIPPDYSAIKINGRRAYQMARNNISVKLKKRPVIIYKIDLLDYHYPILKIKVCCGSGVYIRSLARDIGKELKTGAYMADLVRTRSGNFTLKDCKNIENI